VRFADKHFHLGPSLDKKKLTITDETVKIWQGIVDIMTEFCDVPSALIMRVDSHHIEVFRSSNSPGNPYEVGDREPLAGLYCEEVINRKGRLLVPNALKDDKWKRNPDIKLGMVSYMGFPILWPDGDFFGTICILDSKENNYNDSVENLIVKFKELIESQLAFLYRTTLDRINLEYILNGLSDGIIVHDLDRRILFFNNVVEKITGYKKEEVLGRDCHTVFGSPLCGEKCSFCGDKKGFTDKAEYSTSFKAKNQELRHVEMTSSMLKNEKDNDIGVLAVLKDVTEIMELKSIAGKLYSFDGIIGQDRKMLHIFQQIINMEEYDFPVYIYGETGTGKELIAKAIHNVSQRKNNPFVPINCGALPEGLVESELFGHVKGSFSGAIRDKKGRFELASNGTVFLDEVAELPKNVQVKLLRFLQEGILEKVGSEKSVSVDVRVISATNKDLKKAVKSNKFRDDLFYRLNVIPISIPPLRERKKDIPLLADHFLSMINTNHEKAMYKISDEALSLMMAYLWPGNVRELTSAIQFAVIKCTGHTIKPSDLPLEINAASRQRSLRGPVRKLNAEQVESALKRTGGNKVKAAKLLGVGRATLYRFINDHPEVVPDDA